MQPLGRIGSWSCCSSSTSPHFVGLKGISQCLFGIACVFWLCWPRRVHVLDVSISLFHAHKSLLVCLCTAERSIRATWNSLSIIMGKTTWAVSCVFPRPPASHKLVSSGGDSWVGGILFGTELDVANVEELWSVGCVPTSCAWAVCSGGMVVRQPAGSLVDHWLLDSCFVSSIRHICVQV